MSAFNWRQLKNFERKEWRTNPEKVEPRLILLVDELASYMDAEYDNPPCIIHVAYEAGGHAEASQHYLGLAADLHFSGVALLDQWLAAERFPFTGIGLYPFWNNPGLHLDIRELGSNCGARWWQDKAKQYRKFDKELFEILMGGSVG